MGMEFERPPKFRVGDRVKILDRRYSHGFTVGCEVEIIEPGKFQKYPEQYSYRCSREGVTWFVLESSMESTRPAFILDDSLFEVD